MSKGSAARRLRKYERRMRRIQQDLILDSLPLIENIISGTKSSKNKANASDIYSVFKEIFQTDIYYCVGTHGALSKN